MSIYGIEGKPGSGKTFYCMHHLMKKYFTYDSLLNEWFPKGAVAIISNIDDLRLNSFALEEMVQKAGGRDKFFTVEYQKTLLSKWPRIVYIIDEAGAPDKFHKKFNDEKVLFLFQYHRHLGLDFYLIAPSMFNICDQITRLMESVVRAHSRSKALGSRFRYDRFIEGDRVGVVLLKKEKRVFALYRSMSITESEKVRSVYGFYVFIFAGMLVFVIGGFYYFSHHWLSGARLKKSQVVLDQKPLPKSNDGNQINSSAVPGGPLAEQGVKGGPGAMGYNLPGPSPVLSTRPVVSEDRSQELPSLEELKRDWAKIYVVDHLNGRTIYSEDGQLFAESDAGFLLQRGLRIGGDVYVRRKRPARQWEGPGAPPTTGPVAGIVRHGAEVGSKVGSRIVGQ